MSEYSKSVHINWDRNVYVTERRLEIQNRDSKRKIRTTEPEKNGDRKIESGIMLRKR